MRPSSGSDDEELLDVELLENEFTAEGAEEALDERRPPVLEELLNEDDDKLSGSAAAVRPTGRVGLRVGWGR